MIKTKELVKILDKKYDEGKALFDDMTLEQQFDVVIDLVDNYDLDNKNIAKLLTTGKVRKMTMCVREVNKENYDSDIIVFISNVVVLFKERYPEYITNEEIEMEVVEEPTIDIKPKRGKLLLK